MFTLSYILFKWIEIMASAQLGHSVSLPGTSVAASENAENGTCSSTILGIYSRPIACFKSAEWWQSQKKRVDYRSVAYNKEVEIY